MSPIVTLFEKLAFTTWEVIKNAFEQKISFGEDAITSINLLALKNASFSDLVIADTRAEESIKGCDFEFWIGDYSSGWYRYAIQAKKITVSSEIYKSLNRKVAGTYQINILETYAKANRALPLYCLFNFSRTTLAPSTSCPNFKDTKEFGCSITPLNTTKLSLRTRGARTFEWFHLRRETLPWSCLVRCPQINSHWPDEILGMNYQDAYHKKLPFNLSKMLEHPEEPAHLVDTNMFSQNIEYRPRWIGVINKENNKQFG